MKNSDFRKLLANMLKKYNAYFGDQTGTFADEIYKINYQIINNRLEENQRSYSVDFDIWCKDSLLVDELTDELEELFNYSSLEQNGWATFILETRYNADEKDVYRRTLNYEVRTYQEDKIWKN